MAEIKKGLMGEMIRVENEKRRMMARGKRDLMEMEMVLQGSDKTKH